jgi:D-alanyl-D-alanine carboxypeptidase
MGLGTRFRQLNKLAAILYAATILALSTSPVLAKYAALIMDAETGRVLHAVNPDTRNYPASLTKMMTLYMVFEALEEGKLTLSQHLKASARAARQPASRLGLKKGQTITVEQAILAIVTKSANDVAAMIAENLAGSERDFALRMTTQARKMGMSRTIFRNASGLPHRGQQSTARDMAVLARRLLMDFPQYYGYFSTTSFTYDGIRHKNHNKLLATYDGTDGIKTGYIRASGFNLVASAKRQNQRIIGVLFGGRSPRARNRQMASLLDKGFQKLNVTVMAAQSTPALQPATIEPRQAKNITPQTTPAIAASAQSATPKPRWGIQVGAYHRYAPAHQLAAKVAARFPDLLEDGIVKVTPLKFRKRRAVYRSRILGLTKKQAYRACRVLKKRKMDCMIMRLRGVQLAALEG